VFDLAKIGAAVVHCEGPVTLVMAGPGPALKFIGTHRGTAGPKTFKPETWRERMPLVSGLEILGAHKEADGIELIRTMQATISRVVIRKARHGIHLVDRNRNVIISNCHLYENSGVGIYLDDVNLHQINVANCHVSYNRQGGIVVRDGQVRNLQVSNCDLEGNMPGDTTATRAANVWIDLSAHKQHASVAEVAITGCTIQHSASYGKEGKLAPGGANIRIVGRPKYPVDNVTIGNNVLSDVSVNVDIDYAKDVALTGNTFFTSMPRDLMVRRSQRVVATGNVFNPRAKWAVGGIVFRESTSCLLANTTIHAFRDATAAVLLEGCKNTRLVNCLLTGCDRGIVLRNSTGCAVLDCSVGKPLKGGKPIVVEGGMNNRIRE
jgi:parallel beta-helix repeat protein